MTGNGFDQLVMSGEVSLGDALRRQVEAAAAGQPAGVSVIVDETGRLAGIVTDGDVRRFLAGGGSIDAPIVDLMAKDPIAFREDLSYRAILSQLPDELARRGRRSRRFLGKIVLVDDDRRPVRVLDYHELWEMRVATHRHVVVVGLGYVGLTLALVLAEEGFQVTGTDVNPTVKAHLRSGESHVHEIGLSELLREQLGNGFEVSDELPDDGDVHIITVGTPVVDVDGTPTPSLDHLTGALRTVGAKLRRGGLVVLRSTVPVGTCRTLAVPVLEEASGLRAGRDFHLAFAPERTSEGQALAELRSLPQLIAGLTDDSLEATAALFRELTSTIVRMESLEAAEMAKLVNNTFRDLVFSFANQVAQLGAAWNFDVVDAIAAANRGYPRDPVPLPSPGVGGPCLTKDPHIFAAAMPPSADGRPSLAHQARAINESMPAFVADHLIEQIRRTGRDPSTARVLLCGLAFKGHPETGDIRSSTALDVADQLRPRVGHLLGHDPVVPKDEIAAAGLEPAELPPATAEVDAICFLNNHLAYQRLDVYEVVRAMAERPVVLDGWHLFRADDVIATRPCTYLGLGWVRSSLVDDPS